MTGSLPDVAENPTFEALCFRRYRHATTKPKNALCIGSKSLGPWQFERVVTPSEIVGF